MKYNIEAVEKDPFFTFESIDECSQFDRQFCEEVDDEKAARWKTAMDEFYKVQKEMEES